MIFNYEDTVQVGQNLFVGIHTYFYLICIKGRFELA